MLVDSLRLLRSCQLLATVFAATATLAADADNGKRLAVMHCVPCHVVSPNESNQVAQAPPFEVIARKFSITPQILAFWILDPLKRRRKHRRAHGIVLLD